MQDGACVFRNAAGRGCTIHAYCLEQGLDYHLLKPMVSVLFPADLRAGRADALPARRRMAAWSAAARDPACYDGARDELALLFRRPPWSPSWRTLKAAWLTFPLFADVQAAARRIAPYAVRTPLVESPVLNDLTGGRVFLKLEILQRTGSFKFRGACNRILMIPEAERANGVVAFSSGNHAQGVAAAAQLFGIPALIVMPADAPRAKIEGTRAYGRADCRLYDRVRDDREAIAARFCAERGATLVRPYDDPGIMAGQGTVGLEIAEDAARFGVTLDAVATPCSGGGLVTGVALALKGAGVTAPVHSVEPENFDGMKRSLAAHARTSAPGTSEGAKLSIADALMAPVPGASCLCAGGGLAGAGHRGQRRRTLPRRRLRRPQAQIAGRARRQRCAGGAAGRQACGPQSRPGHFRRQCRFRQRRRSGGPAFPRLGARPGAGSGSVSAEAGFPRARRAQRINQAARPL